MSHSSHIVEIININMKSGFARLVDLVLFLKSIQIPKQITRDFSFYLDFSLFSTRAFHDSLASSKSMKLSYFCFSA